MSGVPQRFLTEFLKIRLAEQLSELEAKIEELKDQYSELAVQTRQRERELRQVKTPLLLSFLYFKIGHGYWGSPLLPEIFALNWINFHIEFSEYRSHKLK